MPLAITDLTGQIYGKLTVLSFAGQNKHGVSMWLCRCSCGKEKIVSSMGMKAGKSTSCGCHKASVLKKGREALHKKQRIHGKSKSREHHIWANILYRCCSPTCTQYHLYGGRGIRVCLRWRKSFIAFLKDMGPAPSDKHCVERIDNDGDYAPCNCRWATRREQANNRSTTRFLKYKGERKSLPDWARLFGLDQRTLHGRILRGWPLAKALETPTDKRYATCGRRGK